MRTAMSKANIAPIIVQTAIVTFFFGTDFRFFVLAVCARQGVASSFRLQNYTFSVKGAKWKRSKKA